MNIALVGYGYWAPNILRAFKESGYPIKYLSDRNLDKLLKAKNEYPDLVIDTDIYITASREEVNAVIITLPAISHFEFAKYCLEQGKHVLVEKPMTLSFDEAKQLHELAASKNLVLMVDHHFIYKDSIKSLKKHVNEKTIGNIHYFDSIRTNLGIFRNDVDVIYDLVPHDISILLYAFEQIPETVSAIATADHIKNKYDNAYITLRFISFIAHIHISWVSPIKKRTIALGGSNGAIYFDDNAAYEKLKIHPVEFLQSNGRLTCVPSPDVIIERDTSNALVNVAVEFIESINNGTIPISNGRFGMAVALIIDAIEESIRCGGTTIRIESELL